MRQTKPEKGGKLQNSQSFVGIQWVINPARGQGKLPAHHVPERG